MKTQAIIWERDGRERKFFRRLLKHTKFYFTWTLAIILMFFLVGTSLALRYNNLGMISRSQAVTEADAKGDDKALNAALADLQSYVGHHMNTSMGSIGIALQGSYNRAVRAAVQAATAKQQFQISPEVYAEYDAECKPRLANGEWSYVNCISSYIDYTGANFDFSAPDMPDSALYYANFTPPHLSLDLAGILVIIDIILLLWIVARVLFNGVLRLLIKIKSRRLKFEKG